MPKMNGKFCLGPSRIVISLKSIPREKGQDQDQRTLCPLLFLFIIRIALTHTSIFWATYPTRVPLIL